ncbi:MAG: hypothetical protein WC156_07330 [Pedobacter sp.]
MATSIKNFLVELYHEYLEEASFLYEQRLCLFHNPEITWLDIEDFGNRFESHIDGLVVGEELALEICKQQTNEGDIGELHAAVRVFCRQNRKEILFELLDNLDPDDNEKIDAVSNALKDELPADWQNAIIDKLASGEEKLIQIISTLIGYRRLPASKELLQLLHLKKTATNPAVIWALGRLREKDATDLLLQNLTVNQDELCSSSALTLLRIGEYQVISQCLKYADSRNWPYIPLSLGGGHSVLSTLMTIGSANYSGSDSLIALGLLGDIATVDLLLSKLFVKESVETAALALNLITGAELYKDEFIPEEFDEEDLSEEELKMFRQGEVPKKIDGTLYGETVNRLSQNPDEWQKWWANNRSRFIPGVRYRNGKPYSPACLLENLQHDRTPHKIRQLAYEELVIRYDVDFPFEADMFVAQQKRVLKAISQWVGSNSSRFKEGAWYFAGRLIAD